MSSLDKMSASNRMANVTSNLKSKNVCSITIEHMKASAVRQRKMEASSADTVRIVSRRMVRPSHGAMPVPPSEDIHLTPWDLCCIPKPTAGGEMSRLVDTLASSLARTLGRYYHLAGRLAVEEHSDRTVTVPLRCTGEGAELVHAAAPGVAVADIVGSVYTPSSVVRAFFPLNGLRGADAAIVSLPVLWAQVTELADGIFIGMSMNHSVGDGTSFWELFNAWSAINRGDKRMGEMVSTPARVHRRWFVDTSPVPIPFPFSKLQDVVQRFELPPVREGFFTFSAASVKKLKARVNDEMAGGGAISSLQALLAHLWRAVSRARRLPPGQETLCAVTVGCRGRMRGISADYVGNAIEIRVAGCTVGEILDNGLGWTAWQLNRVVGSFDEEAVQEWLDRWPREPTIFSHRNSSFSSGGGALAISSSPRFDVFTNDFGWGKPVGVRSGSGDKMNGKVTVFEGPEREGSMSLEVCLAPEALERLVADHEFMDAVSVPPA